MAKGSADQSLEEKHLAGPLTQQLSEREIRKRVLFDILQAKASLVPFAVSFIAFIYTLLYAPAPGGFLIGLGISIGAVLVGLSVFFWRYVICFRHNYALKSQELLARFEAQNLYLEDQRLVENGKLEAGFSEIDSSEGMSVLGALDHEYRLLKLVLSSGKNLDLLSTAALEAMLKETYFRGLSVLQDVLELGRAIRYTNCAQLQSEITELQRKADAALADPSQRERIGNVTERIASNQERLRIVGNLKQRLDELLYQAKRCEASLGKTRIELAAIKADASETGVSAVIDNLQKTIDRAREVQEELKGMGF